MHRTRSLLPVLAATLLAACGGGSAPGAGESATGASAGPSGQQVVNVYNWGDYMAPGVLDPRSAAAGYRD